MVFVIFGYLVIGLLLVSTLGQFYTLDKFLEKANCQHIVAVTEYLGESSYVMTYAPHLNSKSAINLAGDLERSYKNTSLDSVVITVSADCYDAMISNTYYRYITTNKQECVDCLTE
jgi:hypothetical protein